MRELKDGEIGHWILESRSGFHYLRMECPICKIMYDGPSIIEENGILTLDQYHYFNHEAVRIAAGWKSRLSDIAEISLEKVHIHIWIVNLDFYPDWLECYPYYTVEYYKNGAPLNSPREILEGNYDGVIISIFPDDDISLEELEKYILHELIHVAFPTHLGTLDIPVNMSWEEKLRDKTGEEWVENKTDELFDKFGSVLFKSNNKL